MISKIKPFLIVVFVTCLIFSKIFTRGLYPIPGDLLVSFYFPYYSGGWQGYNPWTTHKELLGADSIRQIYLWKEFAASQFKSGKLPLWNPYTFSGQPLAANFQSSVFYPLNIFYFFTDPKNAWILLVITQPLLGGIFMFLALRSFKLSQTSALFGAVAFMFSSYLITWMENGNISHSYIWLPLSFFAINKYFEKYKFRYLLILIGSLTLSILGGHPQTAIYVYLTATLFYLFKSYQSKTSPLNNIFTILFIILSSLALAAIQLLPTYQFYKISPISLPFSREVFDRSILPYKNLVTFLASDFFGHPANNNFWSQSYGDFTPYFGVIPLIFSLWAIIKLHKKLLVRFTALVSIFFVFSAVPGPITSLIRTFKIPLIDATTPSRFISISIYLMIILAAFGFEDFLKNYQDKRYLHNFFKFTGLMALIYLALWAFSTVGIFFLKPKDIWAVNLAVTRRNLILPSLMLISIPSIIILARLIQKRTTVNIEKTIIIAGLFLTTIVGGIYFSNKFMPAAPKAFIFPDHPLFAWLQENAGINRFYGGGVAHIDFNFPTHYQIFTAEGYDTLRIERYAQLLASGFTGTIPQTYLRSDGVFANVENGYRKRLFELLGVKYLLDKEDNPKTGADWHYERFPNDITKGIWQFDKFQIYQRTPTLPRIFMSGSYIVLSDSNEIIKKIYDPTFDLKTLILEKEPPLTISTTPQDITIPQVEKYSPGDIVINTQRNTNSLLFISDAYDPDWIATVDGKKTPILRTHFALESIPVPQGSHYVVLTYISQSTKTGLIVTGLTLLVLGLLSVIHSKKRNI